MASIIDVERHNRDFQPRSRWLSAIISLALIILVSRLWYLQIIKGDYYFEYAARNSFKTSEMAAPRGIIFDAHGNRIADVRPSFDVVIRPDKIRRTPAEDGGNVLEDETTDIRTIANLLSRYIGVDPETVVERYNNCRGRARYKALVIKGDVSRDEMAVIEAHQIEMPGVGIEVSQKRTYPYGELFSHLVGYLGEVHSDELARLREAYRDTRGEDYYEIGDFIGKYGVEKQYEPYLKGQDGIFYRLEDASGRVVNSFAHGTEDGEDYARTMLAHLKENSRPAVAGNDLVLTIDLELQRYVREVMQDYVGSAIALEPSTGRILAMFNNPSFDPEIFARGISRDEWDALRNDPGHPLEDKALRGQYPPGSTFKMIPALAALAENVVTPSTMVYCPGYLKVGGRKFRCHKSGGHGFVDLHKALVYSCDVYFYSIGAKLGMERLARYAREFGLGVPTGLGLNQEKPGLVATEPWKLKVFKQSWVIGDTVSASIGQGYNLVTPLQLARYTAALANGGRLMRPYVVERIQNLDGRIIKETQPEAAGTISVSPSDLEVVQKAMLGVVEDESGTARRSRLKGIHMAGKTGTAQVVSQEVADLGRNLKRIYRDHALFTAYAPFENPEIVVSVLVEHGGHGGAIAAPIARDIMKKFFQDRGRLPKPPPEQLTAGPATQPPSVDPQAMADAQTGEE